ncbi:hypothetical protein lerEdw1_016936 [Lerista edwardsae]|nr:hypothetical protein lerEdw1_016936 [Lerista edwardsae]
MAAAAVSQKSGIPRPGKATSSAPLLSLEPEKQREFQAKVHSVRKAAAKTQQLTPGVIYLGHIPRGLFEPQLKEYFGQFGKVTRLRLSRSKKTGGSKGYAYVEFECSEVAKIVADTMNNYLFSERLLKCEFLPPEKVHANLFKGSERQFHKPSRPAVTRYNRKRTTKQKAKMMRKLLKKEGQLRKRLPAKGIDYDFPGFLALKKKKKLSESDLLMNVSVSSESSTLLCTSSFLEHQKSQAENSEIEETEVTVKLPLASRKTSTPKTKKAKLQRKTTTKKRKCKT